MTISVTHTYVSSITETTPSGGPGGLVGPTEWNATHSISGLPSSGTGITYFSAAQNIADSGTLMNDALLVGGGANGAPSVVASLGTTSQVLHGNAGGIPTWGAVDVTSQITGTLPTASGGTGLTSGQGVLYFSGSQAISGSGTLTANALVLGGGSNTAPAVVSSLGTTSTLLHGNASGAPSFGAVNLASEVSGTLSTGNLQTATTAVYGIVKPDNATISISSGILAAGTLTTANLPTATTAAFGVVKPDNSTVTISSGVLSATGGGGGTPGGASGSIQYNNSSAFGGFGYYDGSANLSLGKTSTAQQLIVYNTVDTISGPTNYEDAIFGWNQVSNVLCIGTRAGGTGTDRAVRFASGFEGAGSGQILQLTNTGFGTQNGSWAISLANIPILSLGGGGTQGLANGAATNGVIEINNGSTGGVGYLQLNTSATTNLPAAATALKGARGSVSDSTTTTFFSTFNGGGSNIVPVFCDGTVWRIG